MTSPHIESAAALKQRYQQLKQDTPKLRARNAAAELGVSEGELLACRVGEGVTRLNDDPQSILTSVETLGEVMALTRNASCVHERHGVYKGAEFETHGRMTMGLFVNPDIDLRLFMNHWAYSFAVTENERKSLQFFDKSGTAVHKIYLTKESNAAAYDILVQEHKNTEQLTHITCQAYPAKAPDRPDADIDWKGLRETWENLQDTHDFYPMLRKFAVGREQAHRHIGHDFAFEVNNTALRQVLGLAKDKSCEIMVFVGNRGCLQIHTGPVDKLVEHGEWYNVLDPKFNLHLRENDIARTWVTRKPTEDGTVTALEIFDKEGELIATLFGKRKPGIPELELWREIIAEIPQKEIAHAA